MQSRSLGWFSYEIQAKQLASLTCYPA